MNLEDIEPNVYPTDLLDECRTALCLYGAGFYGANDSYHMYRRHMHVTVIDRDLDKLYEMRNMYIGAGWTYHSVDVCHWIYEFDQSQYDIVSCDPPINQQEFCCMNLEAICKLARKYVVISLSHAWAYWLHQEYSVSQVLSRNSRINLVVLKV